MLGLGLKREIVALGNNASLVVPMDPALKVHGEVGRGVEAELFGEIFANVRQDVPGIINKGSEKPHGAELHGAAHCVSSCRSARKKARSASSRKNSTLASLLDAYNREGTVPKTAYMLLARPPLAQKVAATPQEVIPSVYLTS